jgi:hypothetical protein
MNRYTYDDDRRTWLHNNKLTTFTIQSNEDVNADVRIVPLSKGFDSSSGSSFIQNSLKSNDERLCLWQLPVDWHNLLNDNVNEASPLVTSIKPMMNYLLSYLDEHADTNASLGVSLGVIDCDLDMNSDVELGQWQSRLHHITRITKWIRTSLSKPIPIFLQFNQVECLSPLKRAMLFNKRVLHVIHSLTDTYVPYPSFCLNERGYVMSGNLPDVVVVLPENITTHADGDLEYIINMVQAVAVNRQKKVEVVYEMDIPYRWEGIQTLIYNSKVLSDDGQRVIDGFEAAEGQTINVVTDGNDVSKQLSQIGNT